MTLTRSEDEGDERRKKMLVANTTIGAKLDFKALWAKATGVSARERMGLRCGEREV